MSKVSQKTLDRIQGITEKVIGKTMTPLLRKMSLPQQVTAARKIMSQTGMANFRANLLKDSGFPSDVNDLFKKGLSNEEIKVFYWQCKEFVDFWTEIGCTENMLDVIIKTQTDKGKYPHFMQE